MYCNYYEDKKGCIEDIGPEPLVTNIEKMTIQNRNYRNALWTGKHLQITLMCIGVGECIGLEKHEHVDQFLRIEEGYGLMKMGDCKDNLCFQRKVCDGYGIVIPAGKWHNLINIGNTPIKLYSIYAPTNHPQGVCQPTKNDPE